MLLLALSETGARAIATGAIVTAAIVVVAVGRVIIARRVDDRFTAYHGRKVLRNLTVIVAVVAIALTWQAFAGRGGLVIGLATAGVAFAMQEVIGAVAGWFNIVSGRVFRVGDRIAMGGVEGDVIDISPLRTKMMEIGAAAGDGAGGEPGTPWVHGRQYTGRIVTVSNKATFTQPVYNYSAVFEYIWEELMLPIPHDADWREAERILLEEAQRISASAGAREAIDRMARHYPMPRQEVEPRVFLHATDDWMELRARFVVPVRTARTKKSDLTRAVKERLDQAGIEVASSTEVVTVRVAPQGGDSRPTSRPST